VIAVDRRQSRVIHRYARALLTKVPAIARLVERDGDEEIDLNNGVTIEIQTASFRSVRGYTLIRRPTGLGRKPQSPCKGVNYATTPADQEIGYPS
jgi:hypothetical protein